MDGRRYDYPIWSYQLLVICVNPDAAIVGSLQLYNPSSCSPVNHISVTVSLFNTHSFCSQPFAIEQAGSIPGTTVTEHGYNGVPRPELTGDFDRTADVNTRARPEKPAFFG